MLGKLMLGKTFRVYDSQGYKNTAKINRSDYFLLLKVSVWVLSGILQQLLRVAEFKCQDFIHRGKQ